MQSDHLYEKAVRPLLFNLDPEQAHNLVHGMLHTFGAVAAAFPYRYDGDDLRTEILGTTVENPVGLAAGFDKNAELVDVLAYLGFGFAEIGSITARSSPGNPKPRLFRLPADRALINRLGLNGQGADAVVARLAHSKWSLPVGINIAKTHDPAIAGDAAVEDIVYSFRAIQQLPRPAYVALNASCPNTREGCMEEKKLMSDVLREMQKLNVHNWPILIKVSPDSSDQLIEDIVEVATENRVAGYVCGNTSLTRDGLQTPTSVLEQIGKGGLSGPPLRHLALELTKKLSRVKKQDQIVIGVGGICSGEDAYMFIRSGASAVEVYTAFVYFGPTLVRRICEQLSGLLKRDGLTLKTATGVDIKG